MNAGLDWADKIDLGKRVILSEVGLDKVKSPCADRAPVPIDSIKPSLSQMFSILLGLISLIACFVRIRINDVIDVHL